jgi:ABC-type transport system substrate-binding protein
MRLDMSRHRWLAVFGAIAIALIASVAAAQTPRRTPAQSIDPFVGTWVLDLQRSSFENMPTPKTVIRTVDYERDGLVLVTAHTTNTAGAMSFVHYLFTLDGKEYEEMSRSTAPNRVPTFMSAAKLSDRALKLTFKNNGKVSISHEWTISEDGRTLTMKRTAKDAQGRRVYSVQVYDKR